MIKWQDIPDLYKYTVAVVTVSVLVLTYHDQFVTKAEAAETASKTEAQIKLMRVDNKEAEKRTLIREKGKAVKEGRAADAEMLEQDIQTLRDQIKSLCENIKEC